MAYTFDGNTKIITLSLGTVQLNVLDLWSRWLDWYLTGDNSKYPVALVNVGGDDIDATSGTAIPIYAFLRNDWGVRPQEAHHTLNVTGAILLREGGGDPFINTTGSFNVRINYSQPVQAITVATGGGGGAPSAAVVASAVRSEISTELLKVDEMHAIAGLNASAPMTVTTTARTAGAISLALTGNGTTTATVTRAV